MYSRPKFLLFVLLLLVAGFGLTLYKHFALGFPLWPGERTQVWTIEAKIEFEAQGEPALVSFTLPNNPPGLVILGEDFASPNYGFAELNQSDQRRAQWSTRQATEKQTVYYRLDVYEKPGENANINNEAPEQIIAAEFEEPFRTAATTLVNELQQRSSDVRTLTLELLKTLNSDSPSQNIRLLLGDRPGESYKAKLAIKLLSLADVPARKVRGLFLESGRRRQALKSFIEIHDGKQWRLFNQSTAEEGIPEHFILWQRGGQSLLDIEGGRHSKVHFSIIENSHSARKIAVRSGEDAKAALIDFSIYSLPIEEQNAFKSILLVPIGAIIVVLMRILVGIRTSGTFMPILIALAFIKTSLLTGLFIFIFVVSAGLLIRSYLSHLNLLLVARISAVIIVVIGLMSIMSIVSQKLGFSQALTVTFFPMIILAWTIERMSILWEEDGPKEVLIQGGGSLFVATLAYLCMTNRVVEYLTFNFPELLFVNLACILLLGQYTGYRLTELRRFQPIADSGQITIDDESIAASDHKAADDNNVLHKS